MHIHPYHTYITSTYTYTHRYRDTARMLAESGLLLALENEKTSKVS